MDKPQFDQEPDKRPEVPGTMEQGKKKQRSIWSLTLMAVAMFGFAFALVPLYDVFCDITGINGKTSDTQAAASERVDTSREVTVEFVSYINLVCSGRLSRRSKPWWSTPARPTPLPIRPKT